MSLTPLEKNEAAEGDDARFVLEELRDISGEKDFNSPVQFTDTDRRCDGRDVMFGGEISSGVNAEDDNSFARSEVERSPSRSRSRSSDAVDTRRERRSAGLGRGRTELAAVGALELGDDVGSVGNKDENIGEGVRGKSS